VKPQSGGGGAPHAAYNHSTMPGPEDRDSDVALTQREQAHLRSRDRKRTTRMVVDNAGVKRVLLARQAREEARRARSGGGSQS